MMRSLLQLSLCLAVGAVLLLPSSALRAQTPQAAPNLTPKRPHSATASSHANDDDIDRTQPVATVNSVAVYRPLMHSVVSSPVDRALLLFAYHQNGAGMSSGDKDLAVKQLEIAQFNGDDKRLDAKLHTLGATRDDYRQFAVEEAKIHDVLRSVASSHQSQTAYLAQLRRNASINSARH